MATDQELITQTVGDYFGGWYDADVASSSNALRCSNGIITRLVRVL